jgi:hypothetical protein
MLRIGDSQTYFPSPVRDDMLVEAASKKNAVPLETECW